MSTDRPAFERITEYPDTPASVFQLQCSAARYSLIRSLSRPDDLVIEVGCGAGVGLSRLRAAGRHVVGVDISLKNLTFASRSAPVTNASAEELPLRSGVARVTALPEAIYYIEDQPAAIAELARVTAPGGCIVVSWPDSRRPGFVASPFATRYPHPDSVQTWLGPWCSSVDLRGAFAVEDENLLVRLTRGLAHRLGLIPRTLHRRGQLKRLLGLGAGTVDDFELDDDCVPHELLSRGTEKPSHIMIYAIGVRS